MKGQRLPRVAGEVTDAYKERFFGDLPKDGWECVESSNLPARVKCGRPGCGGAPTLVYRMVNRAAGRTVVVGKECVARFDGVWRIAPPMGDRARYEYVRPAWEIFAAFIPPSEILLTGETLKEAAGRLRSRFFAECLPGWQIDPNSRFAGRVYTDMLGMVREEKTRRRSGCSSMPVTEKRWPIDIATIVKASAEARASVAAAKERTQKVRRPDLLEIIAEEKERGLYRAPTPPRLGPGPHTADDLEVLREYRHRVRIWNADREYLGEATIDPVLEQAVEEAFA